MIWTVWDVCHLWVWKSTLVLGNQHVQSFYYYRFKRGLFVYSSCKCLWKWSLWHGFKNFNRKVKKIKGEALGLKEKQWFLQPCKPVRGKKQTVYDQLLGDYSQKWRESPYKCSRGCEKSNLSWIGDSSFGMMSTETISRASAPTISP